MMGVFKELMEEVEEVAPDDEPYSGGPIPASPIMFLVLKELADKMDLCEPWTGRGYSVGSKRLRTRIRISDTGVAPS
ncbi:hypothetical protein NPIL_657111 [Nephila pilipes]|uniref:Uncharacterized protein n=1 Tax=Nephila pilipes TaxID=299642 RepID=A0A8X6UVW4_NEPPI|nr:hypothetical protein NPIL_657111 [Nephila pilipes]